MRGVLPSLSFGSSQIDDDVHNGTILSRDIPQEAVLLFKQMKNATESQLEKLEYNSDILASVMRGNHLDRSNFNLFAYTNGIRKNKKREKEKENQRLLYIIDDDTLDEDEKPQKGDIGNRRVMAEHRRNLEFRALTDIEKFEMKDEVRYLVDKVKKLDLTLYNLFMQISNENWGIESEHTLKQYIRRLYLGGNTELCDCLDKLQEYIYLGGTFDLSELVERFE